MMFNHWYTTTVFLTIVLVGQSVYLTNELKTMYSGIKF